MATLAPAAAFAVEPAPRDGFFFGVGLGGGSLSWENVDGDRDAEMSAAVSVRAGYALNPGLLIGLEAWGWGKSYDILSASGDIRVDVRYIAYTGAVTWYPTASGFHVRAGLGAAKLNTDSERGGTLLAETSNGGIALLAGMGWETYFTTHFALGVDGTVTYSSADFAGVEGNDVFGYGLGVGFNWYW